MERVREKLCANCGNSFSKDPRNTWEYWAKAKYCGLACSGKGVANTKDMNRVPIEDKFWNNVEKTDTCWIWVGYADKDGYGVLEYEGKFYRAPAFSLKLDGRPVPTGMMACHTCDNPPCIRPEHLYPGTGTQNVADARARGRMVVGSRHHGAKLNEAAVATIRASHDSASSLAKRFEVSDSLIALVRQRKIWRHVA